MNNHHMMAGAPIMEQLCVTTAIIGLLAVGGKAIDSLYEMNTMPNRETAILNKALQEVKQCRSAAHILYKTFSLLEAGQLPFPERPTWIAVDHLIATLTDTVLAISDLQAAIEPIELCQGLPSRAAQCAEHTPKLTSLCARIRWHNLSMTMMMTILKCPGEADAQNSRVGLERRMTRLLTSNSDLAMRMRRLRDLYGIRAMARGTIPNHAPAAENAPRLPADRTSSSSSLSSSSSGPQSTTDSPQPKIWSILSGYSIANIPILSMIPLPVATLELREGNIFYTFDFARRVSRDLVELMQSGQGNSKMLRIILAKPIANNDLPTERLPLGTNPQTTTNVASNASSVKSSKGFKNPLRYRIRRKKLK
ncbi:hypothetical protein PT974_08008 [Cladobotryum mycophilum]|uniref:Fungal N-terminal domain-containing protein n=1 Tax=Cladobotryum mycophilum TaxID=491253 RepID=A0ABR0SC53_9HYPO